MIDSHKLFVESLETRRLLTCDDISPLLGPEPDNGYGLEICGQVFEDINANGIREENERGLDGWTVRVASENQSLEVQTQSLDLNGDGEIDPNTETGIFGFTNVASGNITSQLTVEERPDWWPAWPRFESLTIPRFALDYELPFGVVPRTDDPNEDGIQSSADIDATCQSIRDGIYHGPFDQNADRRLTVGDVDLYIETHFNSAAGDANLDGVFDSTDLVQVLQANEYEDDIEGNSTWAEGDWNCDGDFDAHDLIRALQTGRYVRDGAAATSAAQSVSSHDVASRSLALDHDRVEQDRKTRHNIV